jgi:hypothetical protein
LQYPHHNPAVLDIALQMAKDYPPDVLILGGDNLDCTSMGSFGPPAETRVLQPIGKDFEGFEKNVLQPLEVLKAGEKVWMRGNHEKWLDDYHKAHPELGWGIDREVRELNLKERGWRIVPYKGYHRVGKLYFHHGDWRKSRQGAGFIPKYHAAKAVQTIHRNIRYGHNHTFQVHAEVNPISSDDAHTGMCIPAACKLNLDYLEGGESSWLNGLYLGWVRPNGDFSDYVLVVSRGRVTFGGKTYEARR